MEKACRRGISRGDGGGGGSFVGVVCVVFWLLVAAVPSVSAQAGQYYNTRCKCICPDPQVVFGNTTTSGQTGSGSSSGNSSNRTLYISNAAPPNKCTCDFVVLPEIAKTRDIKGKEGEFCPRCECKYESRNLQIIKVVVIIVMWVVSLLVIYMLFLMCLDPLVNKRIKSSAYQEHTDEDEDISSSVVIGGTGGGGRTSHPLRVTGGSSVVSQGSVEGATSTTTILASGSGGGGGTASGVLNRVGHQQSKWKRQVQEQRRNIYDRHTMLN